MKTKNAILLLSAITTVFISCEKEEVNTESTYEVDNTVEAVSPENNVQLSTDAALGSVLTDSDGNSLYFFSKDSKDTSECLDGCKTSWPIFYQENITLDQGLEASDFGEITRTDGDKQTTYKGWPLYYFAGDAAPGETNGDGAGDNWYIAKPDYSLMYVQAQLVGKDSDSNLVNYTSDYTPGDGSTFYITAINGRTLYAFINDDANQNNFTKEDFSNNGAWPIFHTEIDKLPSILDASDFYTIDVHGEKQLTYKGHPLYYFGGDSARGDNFGINVPSPGVWPVVNADTVAASEPASASAASAPAPATTNEEYSPEVYSPGY